jgi:hypothetical protein
MSRMNYDKLRNLKHLEKFERNYSIPSKKQLEEQKKRKRVILALIKKGQQRDHLVHNPFFNSISEFYFSKGYLSPKQFRALDRLIHGETFTQKNHDTFKTRYELDLELVSYFDVISNAMNEYDRKSYEFIIETLLQKQKLSESDQWLVDRMNRKYKAY